MVRGRANGTSASSMMLAGPRPHDADAVGEIAGLLQIVGDQQHGRPQLRSTVLHDRPQFLAGELVERAERLVEHQKLRIVDQRAAQRGALQHAAGELPGMLVAEAARGRPPSSSASARSRNSVLRFASDIRSRNGGTILSGSMTLSRTVSHGSMVGFWNAMPTRTGSAPTSRPAT